MAKSNHEVTANGSTGPELVIRNMRETEIPAIQKWIHGDVGWNFGNASFWKLFLRTDPTGWFVGELKDHGAIANVLCARLDDRIALVGLYLVDKEYRFKGYGRVMWNALLNHVGNRVLALYSVDYRVQAYKKLGFDDPTFTVVIYGTQLTKTDKSHHGDADSQPLNVDDDRSNIEIVDVRRHKELLEHLITYDFHIHTTQRLAYIKECFENGEHLAVLAAVDKSWWHRVQKVEGSPSEHLQNGNNPANTFGFKGYGFLVKRYVGYSVSPLYADTPEISDMLYHALVQIAPANQPLEVPAVETFFHVDIPDKIRASSILEVQNNRLKQWRDRNLFNNPQLTNISNKATLYRMYKTDLNPNTTTSNDSQSGADVYSECLERFTFDEPPAPSDDNKHQNITLFKRNKWGVLPIPMDKVFCVSSLEAFWI